MTTLITTPGYHAHVYFQLADEAAMALLQAKAEVDLAGLATVHSLRRKPVGPHPWPMFVVEFAHPHRTPVIDWLQAHHGTQPVLLHPDSGDDLADHRDHACWLGERQALDLSFFKTP
ncbi:MAG: 4,5-dioxygenase [Candidatus Sericytochromatia bacterium]|nr:4,5-dioxygenase [Candidatus Sericytochromatia bacterium]